MPEVSVPPYRASPKWAVATDGASMWPAAWPARDQFEGSLAARSLQPANSTNSVVAPFGAGDWGTGFFSSQSPVSPLLGASAWYRYSLGVPMAIPLASRNDTRVAIALPDGMLRRFCRHDNSGMSPGRIGRVILAYGTSPAVVGLKRRLLADVP